MEKYSEFTKENMQSVREDIQTKLDELRALGLIVELKNITYEKDAFRGKIEARLENADTPEVKEFKKSIEGRKNPEFLDLNIKLGDKKYQFIGFKPRARKNKALIKTFDGDIYRIDFNFIKRELHKAAGNYEECI